MSDLSITKGSWRINSDNSAIVSVTPEGYEATVIYADPFGESCASIETINSDDLRAVLNLPSLIVFINNVASVYDNDDVGDSTLEGVALAARFLLKEIEETDV